MEQNAKSFKYTNTGKIKGKRHCVIGDNKLKKQLSTVLSSMITRCYNVKHKEYKKYGGRGIKICDEWIGDDGLDKFYDWAIANGFSGEKDSKGYNVLSIDRIDNDKGYSPENCRWATRIEQANNKCTSIWVEYNGERDTLINLCRRLNLDYHAVFLRIYRRHWSVEKALSTPLYKDHDIFYEGKHYNLKSLSRELGLCSDTIKYQVVKKGKTFDEAIKHCLALKGV